MNVLDLFSGIGGFSLGLERSGMKTVAFCEQDVECRKVLNKYWPNVKIFKDIKNMKYKDNHFGHSKGEGAFWNETEIDLICGGFPCQDISIAGKQKGLKGERSSLWFEFKRIIKEVRPKYVIVENVANLRNQGLNEILKDFGSIGYDCEWHIISARSIGAPHLRERIWIIAHANVEKTPGLPSTEASERTGIRIKSGDGVNKSPNSNDFRFWKPTSSEKEKSEWWAKTTANLSHWSKIEPPICGVANGLSGKLDRPRKERIKQLGNSVVPQIPELIGRALMNYEKQKKDNKND